MVMPRDRRGRRRAATPPAPSGDPLRERPLGMCRHPGERIKIHIKVGGLTSKMSKRRKGL
jgi:hypothetical protein